MAVLINTKSAFCLLAVIICCSARPKDSSEEKNEEGRKRPMSQQEIETFWKQYPSNPNAQISVERRDFLTDAYQQGQAGGVQLNQIAQEQIKNLKNQMSFLSGLSKQEFDQIVSQISPDQLHQIAESISKIGQQVNSKELIQFGEELSHSNQLTESQVEKLRKVEQRLFRDLKNQFPLPINQFNPNEILEKTKTQLGNQLKVIQQLSEIIGKRISSASQIGESETAAVKGTIRQIQTLGSKIQSDLSKQLDGSELSRISKELLKLQDLASQLQQTVSSQVIQEKTQEVNDAIGQTSSDSDNPMSFQARNNLDQIDDQLVSQTDNSKQTPMNPPRKDLLQRPVFGAWEIYLQNIQSFFDRLKQNNELLNNNARPIPNTSDKMLTSNENGDKNQGKGSSIGQQSQTSNTNSVESNLEETQVVNENNVATTASSVEIESQKSESTNNDGSS